MGMPVGVNFIGACMPLLLNAPRLPRAASKFQLVLLATGVLATAAGCKTIHYTTDHAGGGGRIEQRAPFYLWGLVGEKVVHMGELCPKGPARWYSQQTWPDSTLEKLTLGIYSPRTIVVECSNGAVYRSAPPPADSTK